jgi:SagB-type dehydrogenase family enzyme
MKKLLLFSVMFMFIAGLVSAQMPESITLPTPQTTIGKPLMEALQLRQSTRSYEPQPLSRQELSNLLWAAYGINRPESGKRTAPSAMNWQEMDVYVILAEGIFLYDAKKNALQPVVAGDQRAFAGGQAFVKEAPLNLVYVADFARVTRGSDEDKKLYSAADAGFIAQNVYLYCASQGLGVVVRGGVNRNDLGNILKLRPEQKIILAQTVGYLKK